MAQTVHIGIDLGGTRIRAGRFASGLDLEARSETLTRDEEGPEAVINRMVEQAKRVWPAPDADVTVRAIGVSAPGPIDPIAGVITTPPNLAGWHNVPLGSVLEDRLGARVYLGNDANLAALAEYEMGAGRGRRHMIYLTISTGIGSGVIVDGQLLLGSRGLASECGHLMMVVDGGRVASLEREAAGPAIARQTVAALQSGEQSAISEMVGGDLSQVTAREVGQAAKAGDALGRRLIHRAGWMIGLGIVGMLHAFNPEIIVIGGGVAKGTGELLFTPMWEAIREHALDASFWRDLEIVPAVLGEDVCLIGAGALALRGGK